MSTVVQDQNLNLQHSQFSNVISAFKDGSIEDLKNVTLIPGGCSDVELQRRDSWLQNETVCTIDEHEDVDVNSLKRKLKSAYITETATDKLQKQEIGDSSKEAKEHRRSAGHAVENSVADEDKGNIQYVFTPRQAKYDDARKLALTTTKTPISSDASFKRQTRNGKVNSFMKTCKFSIPEDLLRQYREHFEHAVKCPKLYGKLCEKHNCKEPDKIVAFINENIRQQYNVGGAARAKGQKNVNMVHEVVMDHVVKCDSPKSCNMPICSDYEEQIEKLSPETDIEDTHFQVVYSNNEKKFFYKKGEDFDIPFQLSIGKGACGEVSYSCFVDAKRRKSAVVIKKINLENSEKIWDNLNNAVANLKLVERQPNLLVPNLILRSENAAYLIQEKADMSLFHYMKKVNRLPPNAVAYYLFEMAKAVNQIHSLGLTHGDVKLANCVLLNGCRNLKFIDFDTLKKENEFGQSGTPGYNPPEMSTMGVTKPADLYSLASCIPVMLFGSERILKRSRDDITKFIMDIHQELASIYYLCTMPNPEERITASSLVKWFRTSSGLSMMRKNYCPQTPKRCVTDETLSNIVLKEFFSKTLDNLPQQICIDDEEECGGDAWRW